MKDMRREDEEKVPKETGDRKHLKRMNRCWNHPQPPLEALGGFNLIHPRGQRYSSSTQCLSVLQYMCLKNIQDIELKGSLVPGKSCPSAFLRCSRYDYQENVAFLVH